MNEKIAANNKLINMGLKVPPYFIMNKSTFKDLNFLISKHSKVDYWYLRSIRAEEKIISKRVVTSNDLGDILNLAFLENPMASIIVQERVDVRFSGAIAINQDLIFVEYIWGGLQSLLRDGCTPSRLVLNSRGEIEAHQYNIQEFWYRWDKDKIIKDSTTIENALPQKVYNELFRATRLTTIPSVYEWVEDQKGNVYFIDLKEVPEDFLINKDSLLIGIKQKKIATSDLPMKGNIIKNITSDNNYGVYLLKQPLYDYIDKILSKAQGIVFEKGGVLSHLSLYAAKQHIPCIISPKLYNKLILLNKIDTTVNQLLN